MTLPDYPDFVQSVAFLEQVSTPAGFPANLNPGGSVQVPGVDVAQSVVLNLGLPNGAAGDHLSLTLDWGDGALESDQDVLTFHSAASYGFRTTQIYYQLPVRGNTLALTYANTGAGVLAVGVSLSNRQLADAHLSRQGNNQGRLLLDTGNLLLAAAGASATFYVPPVASRLRVSGTGFATAQRVTGSGVSLPGGTPAASVIYNKQTVDAGGVDVEIACPNTGTEWVWTNNDAAGHTVSLRVWDASP